MPWITDFFDPRRRAKLEKFRTGRLVARSWQIEDLPLAMELWGDPAVTALIDSRGKLTEAQVSEKLNAEIERRIRTWVEYGMTVPQVAEVYGVTVGVIER